MIFSVVYFAVYFGIFFFLLLWFSKFRGQPISRFSAEKPAISILIAARNEAHTITKCLESITRLNYEPNLIEVFIGNDQSTDNTAGVIQEFIKDKPNFRLLNISENLGKARGKANVLAHLTRHATSDYYFITDADMELPADWITGMLDHLVPVKGIVTGITSVTGAGYFNAMQRLDWIYSLGLIQVVSDLGIPVTSMGNNMLITRQAYESTGGYEHMTFSITEDIQLFREALSKGWGFKNIFNESVLALTRPQESLGALMHQRKRWMSGLMYLPLAMKIILVVYASFYVVLIPFFWDAPVLIGLLVMFVKWGFQSLFLMRCMEKLRLKTSFKELVLFEFYQVLLSVLMILFYFMPLPVIWKDRKY